MLKVCLFTVLLFNTVLSFASSFADREASNGKQLTTSIVDYELQYVAQERENIECLYHQQKDKLIAMLPQGKGEAGEIYNKLRSHLADGSQCTGKMKVLNAQTAQTDSVAPLYSQIPAEIAASNCAFMTGQSYFACEQMREQYLAPLFHQSHDSCEFLGNSPSLLKPKYEKVWHAYLLTNGYECTVKEFRRIAMQDPSSWSFQQRLDQNNADLIDKDQITRKVSLAGLNIAYIPYLTYDGEDLVFTWPYNKIVPPRKAELLNVKQFKTSLEKLGAQVRIIHRTTTEDLNSQVNDTLKGLKKFDRESAKNGGYVIVARSFGSAVMTYILNHHRNELPNLKGVLNVAGTPHGSAIAEYKTRRDYFLMGTAMMNLPAAKYIRLIDIADDVDPRINNDIDDFLRASFVYKNQLDLSFKNPNLRPIEEKVDVPVVNYIFLNPTEKSRVQSLDPVYNIMTMYGPVEGSSRLVDSTFESQKHVRVFYDDLGHLAFREFSFAEAINVYVSLFKTMQEEGFITFKK